MKNVFHKGQRSAIIGAAVLGIVAMAGAPAWAGPIAASTVELSLEDELAHNLILSELAAPSPSPSPQILDFANQIDVISFSIAPANGTLYDGQQVTFSAGGFWESGPSPGVGDWILSSTQISLGASTYYTAGGATVAVSGSHVTEQLSLGLYDSSFNTIGGVEITAYLNTTTGHSYDVGSITYNSTTLNLQSYDHVTMPTVSSTGSYSANLNFNFGNPGLANILLTGTLPLAPSNNGTSQEIISSAVPEPSSLGLLFVGVCSIAYRLRRARGEK